MKTRLVLILFCVSVLLIIGVCVSSLKAQMHTVDTWVGQTVTVIVDPYRGSTSRPIEFKDVQLLGVNYGDQGLAEILIQQGTEKILLPRQTIFSITKKG